MRISLPPASAVEESIACPVCVFALSQLNRLTYGQASFILIEYPYQILSQDGKLSASILQIGISILNEHTGFESVRERYVSAQAFSFRKYNQEEIKDSSWYMNVKCDTRKGHSFLASSASLVSKVFLCRSTKKLLLGKGGMASKQPVL